MARKKNYRKKRYRKKNNKIYGTTDKEVTHTGTPKVDMVLYKGIGIPAVFLTKLKYNEKISFTSGPYTYNRFRANSLFDPNYEIGGGQPMYTDQFAGLYERYCVLASTIQVTFINRSASGGSAFTKCGVYPLGSVDASASIEEATERDNCSYCTLGPNTGDQGIVSITKYGDAYKILGKNKDERTDDIVSSDMFANPTRQAIWHVWAGSMDSLSDVSMYADVTITYYVKFYDRVNVLRS